MADARHRFDNIKRRRPENHHRHRMLTPDYVLGPVSKLLGGIGLDPCTEPNNPVGANEFYTPPQDGVTLPWNAATVFCNPPYGEARDRWVKRCVQEAAFRKIVLLIPSATDTKTFQLAMSRAYTALFLRGRLKFGVVRKNGRQEAASHGSVLFGYNVDLSHLKELGVVVKVPNIRKIKGIV